MSRYVFDIESDGLLDSITRIWCIVMKDIDTGEVYEYSDCDSDLGSINSGLDRLKSASLLVGHNIINYDIPAIWKVTGVNLFGITCWDTFVASKTLSYKRKENFNWGTKRPTTGHSLFDWGLALGDKKIDFHTFDGYSKEMLEYCVQDVELNFQVYEHLKKEEAAIGTEMIKKGLWVENEIAKFAMITELQGWNFDKSKAEESLVRMEEAMLEIEKQVEPLLGTKVVLKDKQPKSPKFTKAGKLAATTCRMLEEILNREIPADDLSVLDELPIAAVDEDGDFIYEFQRTEVVQIKVGQTKDVKEWLFANGWEPDEFTDKEQTKPKLSTSSLVKLGEVGEMIDAYYTLRNRRSVISNWLKNLDENGRLHGKMRTIGTPSFRCTHSVVVNLPGVNAEWGKELREVFIAEPGWKVVGADSSGNQLRGLAHYVGNQEFTDEVCFGNETDGTDAHTKNAAALGITRKKAKTFLYCYLFGGGNGKLGQICKASTLVKTGAQARDAFASRITGLQEMNDMFQEEWRNNDGVITGLDGRKLFVPNEHQCLNYILQCAEGITCKAAVVYQMQEIKRLKLRAKPRFMMHDESAWTCHPDDADAVGKILQESFRIAPKWFGVECMDGGDYVVGTSYADVH